jgi:ABC-type phosphate/phosphonate transport system substrate-binding protein
MADSVGALVASPLMPEGAYVAALPMYDWPEVRWATDALWGALAARLRASGVAAPDRLQRDLPLEAVWRHSRLLFGQTCGWPYVRLLRDAVTVVATPGYFAEGCTGTDYCSMLVVRRNDPVSELAALAGQTAAINDPLSLSGSLALQLAAAAAGMRPGRVLLSGSHRSSLRMVTRGEADVCAVDAVCWALACVHEPETTAALRVLQLTPAAPALPYVCAAGIDAGIVGTLRSALEAVLADPGLADVRAALLLSGVIAVDPGAYDRVVALDRSVVGLRLPDAEDRRRVPR